MILRPYYDDDHGCAAYVFGCGTLGQCAVVDARIEDVEAYATFASGKPTSTIAFERRWNPMLSLDRDAFIEALANVPPKPGEMEQILAFNRGHAEMKVQA